MRLPLLQRPRRIYLTACVIREERERKILFVWLGMNACVIKGGERGLHDAQPDTNDASAKTHSWRILGPRLRQNGRCERFMSTRWSAFFIRADANGRNISVCIARVEMPLAILGGFWR
jgi:hypothetical protein